MALFLNPTDRAISTVIDSFPVKAKAGGTCEIPDHKAWAVATLGLPLVPAPEQVKEIDPPNPDKVAVAALADAPVAPVAPPVAPAPVVVSSVVDRAPVATAPVLTVQDTKGRAGRAQPAKDAAPVAPVLVPEKSAEKP